jgi:para-nitrobenzyl esterase
MSIRAVGIGTDDNTELIGKTVLSVNICANTDIMTTTEADGEAGTIVRCPAGTFRGLPGDGNIGFLGIRYATSERFGAPIPYMYPEGIHEMVTDSPLPVQSTVEMGKLISAEDVDSMPQEESCQYLSVTVPEGSRERIPVMVWIHGGAFVSGGCDMLAFDRRPLVSECGVIVVGIGYRLGVLGFLRDREGGLCNNGLLDIIEGLRWVKKNISSFGGDPDNITLFGESAGGEAVRCVLLSDGTEGLYNKAIIQSGVMSFMQNRRGMEEKMLKEMNLMPIDADIDEVKRVQASIESHVTEKGPARFMAYGPNFGVFPLPDESEIPDRLKRIAPDHEIIIGSTAREIAAFLGAKRIFVTFDRFILTRWITEKVVRRWTDKLFTRPLEDFARQYAMSGGKTHFYHFVWMKDYDFIGACHTSDLQLLFGAKGVQGLDIAMGKTESETLEEGKPMRRMWAEFARSGKIEETELEGILEIRRIEGRDRDCRQGPTNQESR